MNFTIFFEYVATVIEAYIGVRFLGVFFENKLEKKKEYLISFITSIAIAAIVLIFNSISLFSYITLVLGVVFVTIVSWKIYNGKLGHMFLFSSIYFMCINYLDFFLITLMGTLLQEPKYSQYIVSGYSELRLIQVFINKVALIIAYLLIRHFVKTKFRKDSIKHYLVLMVIGTFGVINLVKSTLSNLTSRDMKGWIVFSIILFMAVELVVMYERRQHELDMLHFMQMKSQLVEENYKTLNKIYNTNSKTYHDFNNHITVLYQFLLNNEVNRALKYLDDLGTPIKTLIEKTWTSNEVIDVIINSKLEKMNEYGIHSNFNVEFPSNSDIQSQDICAILSNLLDNAIEACEKNKVASNKWINLTIRVINAMIVIKVENSMEVKPIIKNNNLLTSKADDKLHGWGIKIVKSAVEKYGGVIKYTVSEDKFRVVVTLNYNKSEEYYRINE